MGWFCLAPPGRLALHMMPDLANLIGKVFLDYLPPHASALTVFVRALFQESQLLAPLPDEGIQPEQLRLQFEDLFLFAFHHEQVGNRE
jgi:hypothetical protein